MLRHRRGNGYEVVIYMTFLMQIAAMLTGIVLVLWGRAVLAVGREDFSWQVFFGENLNRVAVAVSGAIIVAIAGAIDAGGLQSALDQLPVTIQAGTGLGTGIAIATVVIVGVPLTLGSGEPPEPKV
jgi:hypothetical protein